MLAVSLGVSTFVHLMRGALVISYVDNDGARAAIQHGGNRSYEVSHLVHYLWIEVSRQSVGWYTARVESHANIADAPSRGDLSAMRALGAIMYAPRWPEWALELWK